MPALQSLHSLGPQDLNICICSSLGMFLDKENEPEKILEYLNVYMQPFGPREEELGKAIFFPFSIQEME